MATPPGNPTGTPLIGRKEPEGPTVKIARSKDELIEAFKLIYRSYLQAGLTVNNPSGLRLTPFHLLSSSEVFVSKIRGSVFSTVSLFCDGELGLPMQTMYPKEIETLRNQGLKLAEVGSLADRRSDPKRFLANFVVMSRLMVQHASKRGIDALVAVVHPKHARLYKRILGFKQVGDHTDCPYANGNPAEALYLRFEDYRGTRLHDDFFGTPHSKYELESYDWEPEVHEYFSGILEMDSKIANTVGIDDYFNWGVPIPHSPIDVTAGLSQPTQSP